MALNDLSLSQLKELADDLASLAKVGQSLAPLNPIFDLTPGQPTRITLDQVMPTIGDPGRPYPPRPIAMAGPWNKPEPTSTEAAPPEPALDPVEAPLAAEGPVEGATETAEPTDDVEASRHLPQVAAASKGEADSGGGEARAAAEASAAPVPGSASAMAATWQAPLWTAEEDAKLIGLVVRSVTEHGLSRNAAAVAAARELGRAEEGVKFRCKTKLKARIDAAISDAAMVQAQTETPEIPATMAVAPEQAGEAVVGGHSPAAVQTDDNGLTAHLLGITGKGGWSLARDLELIELSCDGWQANEIALQIQMQASAIKPRFDTLTGLYTDEVTGKKVRRWTREEVLGALLVMAGKAEAA